MNIGDRIKVLRKSLGLTQALFAEKIGLRATAIGLYESGNRAVTERSIISICKIFGVNEDWLRNGTGEMFVQQQGDENSQLAKEYSLDPLGVAILKSYNALSQKERNIIGNYIRQIAKEYNDISEKSTGMVAKLPPAESHVLTEEKINKEVEDYRRELEEEKSTQTSEASANTGEDAG